MDKIQIIQSYQNKGAGYVSLMATVILLSLMLSSCAFIEDIFKAGIWIGFIIAAVIVGLVLYLLAKVRRRK